MPLLLPVVMCAALGLFAAWVALMLRLEPTEQAPVVPVAAAVPAVFDDTMAAVVVFPSFSGVGGDAALLTDVDRAA
jgi:hypothetical protein